MYELLWIWSGSNYMYREDNLFGTASNHMVIYMVPVVTAVTWLPNVLSIRLQCTKTIETDISLFAGMNNCTLFMCTCVVSYTTLIATQHLISPCFCTLEIRKVLSKLCKEKGLWMDSRMDKALWEPFALECHYYIQWKRNGNLGQVQVLYESYHQQSLTAFWSIV